MVDVQRLLMSFLEGHGKDFFFSYSYDLTNSLQHNMVLAEDAPAVDAAAVQAAAAQAAEQQQPQPQRARMRPGGRRQSQPEVGGGRGGRRQWRPNGLFLW